MRFFSVLKVDDEIFLARHVSSSLVRCHVRMPYPYANHHIDAQRPQSSHAQMPRHSGKGTSRKVYILMCVGFLAKFPAHRCIPSLSSAKGPLSNCYTAYLPRKHTVAVKPAERVSVAISADAPGPWAFHCHLLFHMEAGIFRVVEVVA